MLVIDFAPGTKLYREADRLSQLPIVRNGPPGTFVLFPDGLRVSLPTDQIVSADDNEGYATVSFAGIQLAEVSASRLTFRRVRELRPEEELSPERSHTMHLELTWVTLVRDGLQQLWPPQSAGHRGGSGASERR